MRLFVAVGLALLSALPFWDMLTAGMTGDQAARRGVFIAAVLADDDDDDDDKAQGPQRRPTFRQSAKRRAPPPSALRELIVAGVTEADLARLRNAGFTIVATRRLAVLPEITARLRAPLNLSERRAIERVRILAPPAIVDVNHLFRPGAPPCPSASCFRFADSNSPPAGTCVLRGRVGMIDTAIDIKHPALTRRTIVAESVRGPARLPSRPGHGTEIAILLVAGAAPESDFSLVAIDAFHQRGGADYADAFDIVAALDRLVAKDVLVINLSFAGPANELLDRAGAKAAERGAIVVAAAGNDGPTAPTRYPAGYSWAIAVTAVDRSEQIYVRAVRGPHLAFAAAGVRVQLPDLSLRPGPIRSGTSFAVPRVTAAIAAARTTAPTASPPAIIGELARQAKDLGAPGRDPVFGWGLIDLRQVCAIDRNAGDTRR